MNTARTRIGDLLDSLTAATLAIGSFAVIGSVVAKVAGLA